MRVSIATYNVHRCIGRDGREDPGRIAAVLRALDADAIALQELRWQPSQALHVLADLAARLGYTPLAGPTLLRPDGHYGNALLTRLPVDAQRLEDLSVPGREPRGALAAMLRTEGGPLTVIATHLGLAYGERRRQMQRLLALVRKSDKPVVLLGDLNEWLLWGRPLRWLRAHFGRTPAPATFPARWPLLALDRIWVEPASALERIEVHAAPPARTASDHLPLRATLALH
ncbi:MAG TPA: endonuclease/exonuclease/phosphatase family protein [Burkholderiales bacterium]|nr:endonuclease/exonuclease/phosphatase family protein [Burkholderiales bacterium]